MINVYSDLTKFLENEIEGVLISVVQTKGSVPRDTDAFMLVNQNSSFGTVGGGCLEFDAIQKARDLVKDPMFSSFCYEYHLGPKLGQCCGGAVELNFKKITPKLRKKILTDDLQKKKLWDNVLVFGAGHVGQALIQQMQEIPLNVSLIDSRSRDAVDFLMPESCKTTPFPEAEVRKSKPGSAYVIVTHDHALDFILVKEVLLRNDAVYLGMIGSDTKKLILKKWLKKEGISGFEKIFTPLGKSIASVKLIDKRPEVIAAFVLAEILVAIQTNKSVLKQKQKKEVVGA